MGVPLHDDQQLYALLMLEGFQAGLSWITILRKRENFARAFDDWDPVKIATYDEEDRARLMGDAGIVRNRLKVAAATQNARAWLQIMENEGSFDRYLWNFVDGVSVRQAPRPTSHQGLPATTPLSDAISKDLKKRGFTFVGSTIVYSFLQSAGLVDDHMAGCWRVET